MPSLALGPDFRQDDGGCEGGESTPPPRLLRRFGQFGEFRRRKEPLGV